MAKTAGYDDQKTEGSNLDDLGDEHMRRVTGIDRAQEAGIDRDAETDDLDDDSSAPSATEGGSNKSGKSKGDSDAESPESLKKSESDGNQPGSSAADEGESSAVDSGTDGPGLYRNEGGGKDKKKKDTKASRNKKLIGVGATGGITALIIALLLSLIPLKIVALMDTLQNRFFGEAESLVSKRTEKLFDSYVKKHVLPGLTGGACTTTMTADRSCFHAEPGANPASRLFHAWSDARLENKMALNYGLEISSNASTGTFNLKANGLPSEGLTINTLQFNTGTASLEDVVESAPGGTKEFRTRYRAAFNEAMDGESRLKKAFYRFKFGRLVEKKHGIRRCVFACDVKDDFGDWKTNRKNAAKLWMVRRIIQPHNELVGFALECIISGDCSDVPRKSADGTERQDIMEKKIRAYLDKRGAEYTKDTVGALVKLTPALLDITDKGLSNYLVTTIVEKIATKEIADMAAKSIPVIGWIDLTAKLVNFLHDSGPKVKRWGYALNTTAYVSQYMMYRTFADEMKSGHVDSELVGSMMETLGDETGDKDHRGQPAEISPVYQEIFETSSTPVAALSNMLSPGAHALTAQAAVAYTCDSGSPPYVGFIVCPEESLKVVNWLTEVSAAFAKAPLNVIAGVADFWRSTGGAILSQINGLLGPIFGLFNSLLDEFPIIGTAKAFFETQVGSFLNLVATWMFPSPLSPTQSGARAINGAIAGADAAASTEGQDGLGGQLLTPQQSYELRNDYEDRSKQEFASKPFLYRMFSTASTRSFVSQLALSIPNNKADLAQSTFASLITNPFSKLFSGFSSFLSRPKLLAAPGDDPFGIPQFGYPLGSPMVNMDEEILTDEYCKKLNDLWVENDVEINPANGDIISTTPLPAEGDPDLGIDIHHSLNPCLLEQTTVGSAGGYFDDSTLSPGDVSTEAAP